MFWLVISVMLAAAVATVVVPIYRAGGGFGAVSAVVAVVVLAGSVATYYQIGRPDAQATIAAGAQGEPDIEAMVESLAARLEANPGDVAGWKMLGRSYAVLRRYPEAIAAYERAMELENSGNAQTIADLGETVFMADGRLEGRPARLFENALAIAPDNPKALFYSGMAAAERGDRLLAADRWEALIATSPPPDIENVLQQRVAEWRGTVGAEGDAPSGGGTFGNGPSRSESSHDEPLELTVSLALGDQANGAVDPASTVFLIARDPAQPSPPIAAVRLKAAELPADYTLTDADAMIPGRVLSGFTQLEIVARASSSGQPIAQPGDWFGRSEIDTTDNRTLSIVIDQQVP